LVTDIGPRAHRLRRGNWPFRIIEPAVYCSVLRTTALNVEAASHENGTASCHSSISSGKSRARTLHHASPGPGVFVSGGDNIRCGRTYRSDRADIRRAELNIQAWLKQRFHCDGAIHANLFSRWQSRWAPAPASARRPLAGKETARGLKNRFSCRIRPATPDKDRAPPRPRLLRDDVPVRERII